MTVIKKYANIKELAEYTGVPKGTLYDWAANGKIPSIKKEKKVLFDLSAVDKDFDLNKRNVKPQSEIVEEKAKTILSSFGNTGNTKTGKTNPSSSENEAYNGGQQHNQRDLSEEKGDRHE